MKLDRARESIPLERQRCRPTLARMGRLVLTEDRNSFRMNDL